MNYKFDKRREEGLKRTPVLTKLRWNKQHNLTDEALTQTNVSISSSINYCVYNRLVKQKILCKT